MQLQDLEGYLEILRSFDNGMLVTRRDDELRSRPMAIAEIHDDGRITFVSSIDSGKIEEITDSPAVNLALQDSARFLSVSGTSRTSRNRERIDDLWSPAFNAWFEKGRHDPAVVLLEIVPTYAEYWDHSGSEYLKKIFDMASNVIGGQAADSAQDSHAKIDF